MNKRKDISDDMSYYRPTTFYEYVLTTIQILILRFNRWIDKKNKEAFKYDKDR